MLQPIFQGIQASNSSWNLKHKPWKNVTCCLDLYLASFIQSVLPAQGMVSPAVHRVLLHQLIVKTLPKDVPTGQFVPSSLADETPFTGDLTVSS